MFEYSTCTTRSSSGRRGCMSHTGVAGIGGDSFAYGFAVDVNILPPPFRIGYHVGSGLFYIAFDIALHPLASSPEFSFYIVDPTLTDKAFRIINEKFHKLNNRDVPTPPWIGVPVYGDVVGFPYDNPLLFTYASNLTLISLFAHLPDITVEPYGEGGEMEEDLINSALQYHTILTSVAHDYDGKISFQTPNCGFNLTYCFTVNPH
eukprot:CAMPEP_0174274390 /NCGR_PEP_ID=MMETSP0439-20130205/57850_1 /TAXON_ID=0 /ORGANISM="Stereomyxa ramosa, Strain Chinc5" /LENGTH=204 /DNA_ID=CAMNT_0015366125 /DNA_START=75 /DNA_END=686 /DNA_ORIENTATION=-